MVSKVWYRELSCHTHSTRNHLLSRYVAEETLELSEVCFLAAIDAAIMQSRTASIWQHPCSGPCESLGGGWELNPDGSCSLTMWFTGHGMLSTEPTYHFPSTGNCEGGYVTSG